MYVWNHTLVPALAWYFLISMGWGTGKRPTRVPCWRKFRISDSSVRPLKTSRASEKLWQPKFCSQQLGTRGMDFSKWQQRSYLKKHTCQCKSSPLEEPGLVTAAWLSEEEALLSMTSPEGHRWHKDYLQQDKQLHHQQRWWSETFPMINKNITLVSFY